MMLTTIPGIYKALLLLSGTISTLVGILLLHYSREKRKDSRMLAISFFFLAYPLLLAYSVATGIIYHFPHLYRTGFITILLYPCATFIYVRTVLTGKRINKKDWVHLIPSILYIIDYIPFFLLQGSEKMNALNSDANVSKAIILFKESMIFPPGFYMALRYGINLFYWILSFNIYRKTIEVEGPEFKNENQKLLRWLKIFIFLQASLLMPPLTIVIKQIEAYQYFVYIFEIGGVCAIAAISLFFFPEILYSLKGIMLPVTTEEISPLIPAKSGNERDIPVVQAVRYLPAERVEEIGSIIVNYLITEAAYLKPHYTIQHLAIATGVSYQYISAFINTHERMNFNDYINGYRIKYSLKLLHEGEYKQKTLESIAAQCGFSNRNTFTLAFKKATGKTPSVYIKQTKTQQ